MYSPCLKKLLSSKGGGQRYAKAKEEGNVKMLDIYYSIIVGGGTLAVGFIPILSKKLRGENFLVSYRRPDSYGEEEKRWEINTPGGDAGKHLDPAPNSEVKMVTYNFPKQEYEDPIWIERLKSWHENGVRIKIVGGPKIEAEKAVNNLLKEGIIEVKRLKKLRKPRTYHVAIATPLQLWIEEYHKDGDATDCTFTTKPYEWVWKKANSYFDKLWKAGKSLQVN